MKSKFLIFYILFCLFLIFLPVDHPSNIAHAKSWTQSVDKDPDLYGGNADQLPTDIKEPEELKWYEEIVVWIIAGIGQGFENLFNLAGVSLDSIVYGRVNGSSRDGVALFTFELNEGNPYGLVGASLYMHFRTLCYALITVIVIWKLSFASFKRVTAESKTKNTSFLLHMALSFLLLALMPYLLDVILYVRDVILQVVTKSIKGSLNLGSTNVSLMDIFRKTSDTSITGAIVYLAAVVFSLYLGFTYVGYALSFLVCFAGFPFVVVASNFKRDLLSNWVSTVSYFIIIPLLDAPLLLVPACMISRKVSGIITLLCCLSMLSARSIFARLLGVSDSGSGLLGFAAIMAVGRLAGSVIGAGKNAIGGISGAVKDRKMSKYEGEMAEAEEGGGADGSQSHSQPISAGDAGIGGTPSSPGSSGTSSTNNASVIEDTSTAEAENSSGTPAYSQNHAPSAASYGDDLDSPLGSQLSHKKKAELYKKRARVGLAKSISSTVGGAVGGIAGGAAGLMMGPAVAAMGASVGVQAGSAIGSSAVSLASGISKFAKAKLRFSTVAVGDTVDTDGLTDQIEHLSGSVDSNNSSLPSVVSASCTAVDSFDAGIDTSRAAIPDSIDGVSMQDMRDYMASNMDAIINCSNSLNEQYINDPSANMKVIYDQMITNGDFKNIDSSKLRDTFRERVYNKYMNEYEQRFANQPSRVLMDEQVERVMKNLRASQIKKTVFDKNNDSSFVSDSALDSYDWFNF